MGYMGTWWWRIPREFKTTDIGGMAEWMEQALALPIDADLKALGLAAQRDGVAMPGAHGAGDVASSRQRQSNLAEQTEDVEDESEEEYQPRERGQMAEDDDDGDDDEAAKKRKKKAKKERKKQH